MAERGLILYREQSKQKRVPSSRDGTRFFAMASTSLPGLRVSLNSPARAGTSSGFTSKAFIEHIDDD